jgi:GNAT superfamily N-acetyltransferase
MSDQKLLDASQVDPSELDAFLRRVYSLHKCDFLRAHGAWLHRSNANRLIVEVDGRIAGYCALIPTRILAAGRVHSAYWWVDLVIAPEYRGLGLQRLVDKRVREMSDLLMGFPNALAGIIHRKHNWGLREDARVLLLPLDPANVKTVRHAMGWRGLLFRTAALVLGPLAMIWRSRLLGRKTPLARRLDTPDWGAFANIFRHAQSDKINTTWRDEAYFLHRYQNSPSTDQHRYYLAGTATPTHYLIARHLTQPDGLRYTRILDIFGDFADVDAIRDLMTLAVRDAIAFGASQVTLVASIPRLKQIARRLGFVFSAPFGFCWWSATPALMASFHGEHYWTLSDSDNDETD